VAVGHRGFEQLELVLRLFRQPAFESGGIEYGNVVEF
jgi:hypothetical protein